MSLKHIIILLISLIFLYSAFIEPNLITVKRLHFKSSEIKNLKIVFVSDFHLSKFDTNRLNRIIKKVNDENSDIIISGGDYVIAHSAKASMNLDKMASMLSLMKSKYGIYSVLGNHDSFKDGSLIEAALKKAKINVIENKNVLLDINGSPLYIAGISDMQTTFYNLDKALDGAKKPIILVSHSPDITPFAKDKVNLILSGHTHGGQIRIPFYGAVIVPSRYGKRYETGFVENIIYITKGLGTSIFHLRFNCPPEITVIEFN